MDTECLTVRVCMALLFSVYTPYLSLHVLVSSDVLFVSQNVFDYLVDSSVLAVQACSL